MIEWEDLAGGAACRAARPAWGAEGSLGQRPNVPGAVECLKKE